MAIRITSSDCTNKARRFLKIPIIKYTGFDARRAPFLRQQPRPEHPGLPG